MRRVTITVDVEAHKPRALDRHVRRLIWGRQGGREAGIQSMMDIADRHGVPVTFFLDYPEAELYGEELLDAGREILRRGHDLEPHCHTEYLMPVLFGERDPLAVRVPKADLAQSLKIVDYLVERHIRLAGEQPLAHRSGAYMLGPRYLAALRQRGFQLDASYNLLCTEDPMLLGLYAAFRWQNGVRELPVPIVPFFRRQPRLVPWNFNASCFTRGSLRERLLAHQDFLKTWFARHGDEAVPSLVMHSWSFWRADARGFFTEPDDEAVALFDALLENLRQEYQIVSIGRIAREELEAPKELEPVAPEFSAACCPVCFEPASHFQDYARPKRLCPFCGSLERHRTLVDLVYQGAFGPGVFRNRDILHIAPASSERLLLKRMVGTRITTLDIMPGCDMRADISAMPEVPDNSFDIALASGVFQHVRHLDRALAEIARVLRPGGLLLCSECMEDADHTREIADIREQAAWYGLENLEKYGVGLFRSFGRKDWEKTFAPYFHTRLFKADDKATGSPAWWLACVPKADAACAQRTGEILTSAMLRSNAGRILFDARHDPVQTFLPAFRAWRQYRASVSGVDLVWLKKIIFALHFERFRPLENDLPPHADFPASYPSGFHPYTFQSFYHLLSFLPPDPASGDSRQLRQLFSEAERWIDAYGFYADSVRMDPHTRQMVWHDTAVASRLNFLSYILLRMLPLPLYADALCEKIFRAAADHFLLLCADHFFTGRHNHGLLQILGLLAFASAWPGLRGASSIRPLAAARLNALLERMLSQDGIVREHSPEYHAAILPLLSAIADFLTDDSGGLLRASIGRIRQTLAHFVRPDGLLAPFGDTPPYINPTIDYEMPAARARCADLPALALFPGSGYAFLRLRPQGAPPEDASCLALQGAFYSLVHKHCDDLAFVWSEGGQNLLVDSGQQYGYEGMLSSGPLFEKGFYYSAPNRVYSESVHAHNCVEINGECYSRAVTPYGALPLSGGQLAANCWFLRGEWQRPEGFRQRRRLVFSPGRWLLVMDRLEALPGPQPGAVTFSQWFHCDASLALLSHADGAACLLLPDQRQLHWQNLATGESSAHRGEYAPRLQGWQATESTRWLNPAWALGIHQKGESAVFHTLFSLMGPCTDFNHRQDACDIRFANGESFAFAL